MFRDKSLKMSINKNIFKDYNKTYNKTLNKVNDHISQSINSNDTQIIQSNRESAIQLLQQLVNSLDIRDYLLLDSNPVVSKETFIESLFTLGTLYKSFVETEIRSKMESLKKNNLNRTEQETKLSETQEQLFKRGIECFTCILRISFEDDLALKQITSIYTQLCFFAQDDINKCLQYMQEALLYSPNNETIHYNLGYTYQRLNKLELSIIHYKISISLAELYSITTKDPDQEYKRLKLNSYNGISGVYRSIKQWPEALHYLLKAEKIDKNDPDIQNQLGVVYTEMRRTDLAEIAYNSAIKNYKRSFISSDHKFLLAELYLNLGHMHSYNGDNSKSIDNYNKSLQVCPNFALPFQNKIMNLSYLFDQLEDKMYIYNQHKLVNKLYKKGNGKYTFPKDFWKGCDKINIGIISGDFVEHPVSFFISTLLKKYDTSRFNITCYSECIINTSVFNSHLQFKTIKNHSADLAADIIHNDKIHILFDLAGHTAFNRLDIFALKPSPIQITYIGYPYSTGLDEMDYRITDYVCDGDLSISQKFYTEKLLPLKNSFLCYDPTVIKRSIEDTTTIMPELNPRDPSKNFITFGCFNRLNKMTDSVILLFNKILMKFLNSRFVFKTKALINTTIKNKFLNKFDKNVRSRITVLDCTLTHESHLLTYNQIDIAIDTFPYSGTTTTCESLYMGVPVFSLYDSEYYFHAQNVSCSILKNSDLDYYIFNNEDELFQKIEELNQKDTVFWKNLKVDTRNKFTNGKVCNKEEYISNIQELFTQLYNKHSKLN